MNKLLHLARKIRDKAARKRHFYSPAVDPNDPVVKSIMDNFGRSELTSDESLSLNTGLIEEHLNFFSSHYHQLKFPEVRTTPWRYYYENPYFSYGDAITLFGMMKEYRPKKIVEAGSGFSSCVMMDFNDRCADNSRAALTFIEPYPHTLLSLIEPQSPYLNSLQQQSLQRTHLDTFRQLQANDILFIDSTHVAKTGSDVLDLFFRILPALAPGVLIHLHDIPYPFEYSPEWINDRRSWNEVYFLRAFLQYNSAFEIIYFNHFVHRHFHDELAIKMPLCLRNCGGSIWLRKRGVPDR